MAVLLRVGAGAELIILSQECARECKWVSSDLIERYAVEFNLMLMENNIDTPDNRPIINFS